jgi:hypothetical protein
MPFRVVSDVSTGISTTVEITDAEQAKQDVLIRGEIQWSNEEIFRRKITSIGVAPTEIYRVSLVQLTGYSIYVTVIGVDRGNGNVKKQTGDFTLKRLNAGPLLVGQTNFSHIRCQQWEERWCNLSSWRGRSNYRLVCKWHNGPVYSGHWD